MSMVHRLQKLAVYVHSSRNRKDSLLKRVNFEIASWIARLLLKTLDFMYKCLLVWNSDIFSKQYVRWCIFELKPAVSCKETEKTQASSFGGNSLGSRADIIYFLYSGNNSINSSRCEMFLMSDSWFLVQHHMSKLDVISDIVNEKKESIMW